MNPLVSIIIPAYNRKDFLKQAIESVESQTYTHYELIIVDDGSTDSTREYLHSIVHPHLFLHHSGKPGYVRNRGFLAAKGEYIAFLDSDDLWKPEKIEKQILFFMYNPGILICHTQEIWQRNGKIISQKKQKHKREGDIFFDSLKKCIIGPSTVMMKRNLFIDSGMFHPGLEIAEDYELWLRITAHHQVGYIDESLVIKRGGHADQLSEKYGHIEYFRIQALVYILEQNILSLYKQYSALTEIIRKCRIYTQGCLKRGKKAEANKYMNLTEKYKKELENFSYFDNHL